MLKHLIAPLLITVYPSLFLYSRFHEQVEIHSVFVTLGLSLIALLCASLASFFVTRKWGEPFSQRSIKTALTICVLMLLFMVYGHIFSSLYYLSVSGLFYINRHNIPIESFTIVIHSLLIIMTVVGLIYALRFLRNISFSNAQKLSSFVLIFIAVLCLTPILTLLSSSSLVNPNSSSQESNQIVINNNVKQTPSVKNQCKFCDSDVYIIILDAYARNDTLTDYFNFDNTPFLDQLKSEQFQVFDQAKSNYAWTFLSIASSLNFNYIESIENLESHSIPNVIDSLRNNKLSQFLKNKGYKYVHLASTYGATMFNPYADQVHTCKAGWLKDDFLRVYIEGTFLRIFNSGAVQNLALCYLDNFSWLKNIAKNDGDNKFVLSHFVMPHHPYLFNSKGDILSDANLSDQFQYQKLLWADRKAYVEQLQFINTKILGIVKKIKNDSENPPFIIIMSDHGPQLVDNKSKKEANYLEARSSSFLAVLTPDLRNDLQIKSSVNIFRTLLNEYFNQELEILPNNYYDSYFGSPFKSKEYSLENKLNQ